MTVEEYLRSVDLDYGSQQHQRDFLERMRRAQELSPCSVDHSEGLPRILIEGVSMLGPPCHRTSCYPTNVWGRVGGS